MKNKAVHLDYTQCDVHWFEVVLFGAFEGVYQAMLMRNADKEHWAAKEYFNLYVWSDFNKKVLVDNADIIDLVYEAIFEQENEIRE